MSEEPIPRVFPGVARVGEATNASLCVFCRRQHFLFTRQAMHIIISWLLIMTTDLYESHGRLSCCFASGAMIVNAANICRFELITQTKFYTLRRDRNKFWTGLVPRTSMQTFTGFVGTRNTQMRNIQKFPVFIFTHRYF